MLRMILVCLVIANTCLASEFGMFKKQVTSFTLAAKRQNVRISLAKLNMSLADSMPIKILGLCVESDNQRMIFINTRHWIEMDDIEREELIWHELGHCVLGRNHELTLDSSGHPESIMYPDDSVTFDKSYYLKHKANYEYELFHPNQVNKSESVDKSNKNILTILQDYGIIQVY